MIAVISWGLLRGPHAGLLWAIFLGLLLDQLSPQPIGMYTLPLMAVTAVVAIGRRLALATHLLVPLLAVVAGTFVHATVQLVLIAIKGGHVPTAMVDLGALVLPLTALNLLWLPVIYIPLRALALKVGGPRLEWGR